MSNQVNTNIVNASYNTNSSIQHFLKINNYAINNKLIIDAVSSRITNVNSENNVGLDDLATLDNLNENILRSETINVAQQVDQFYTAQEVTNNVLLRDNIERTNTDTFPSSNELVNNVKNAVMENYTVSTLINNTQDKSIDFPRVFSNWESSTGSGDRIIFNNGRFISRDFYSDDTGFNAQSTTGFTPIGGTQISANNNTIIIGGNPVARSTDNGISYTSVSSPSLIGVDYSPSLTRWVGVGNGLTAFSDDDGISWTSTTQSQNLRWVVWSEEKNIFVSCGGNASSDTVTGYSTDGISWNFVIIRPDGGTAISVTYFSKGGNFIIPTFINNQTDNRYAASYVSDDGISWTSYLIPNGNDVFFSDTEISSYENFVFLLPELQVKVSQDGIVFYDSNINPPGNISSLAVNPNNNVVVGISGTSWLVGEINIDAIFPETNLSIIDYSISGDQISQYGTNQVIVYPQRFIESKVILENFNNDTARILYNSSTELMESKLENDGAYFRFDGLKRDSNSLEIKTIVNVTNVSNTYLVSDLINSIINRDNTPATDALPTQNELFFSDVIEGDSYTFIIRNVGNGDLTLDITDLVRDTEDVFSVSLGNYVIPSNSSAEFIIYYVPPNFHINMIMLTQNLK